MGFLNQVEQTAERGAGRQGSGLGTKLSLAPMEKQSPIHMIQLIAEAAIKLIDWDLDVKLVFESKRLQNHRFSVVSDRSLTVS
jgi:hypothetical protein